MNLFASIIGNLLKTRTAQNAVSSVKNYFDPTSGYISGTGTSNNFWTTPFAKVLSSLQQGSNFIADKARFDFTSGIKTGNQYTDFAAKTLAGIPESIINIPSNTQRAGRTIGQDINSGAIKNPRIAISDLAGAADPLLTIATLGVGSSVLKNAGKLTIKELLAHGAKSGLKYGTAFGGLGGLESGRTITDPKQYAQNLVKDMILGAGTGTVLGTGLAGISPVLGKAGDLYKKSPLANEQGFIRIGDSMPDINKVGSTLKDYQTPDILKGQNLTKEQSLQTLRNKSSINIELHNKIYNALSRAGEKNFAGDKAQPALGYYLDNLGAKEVNAAYKKWLVDPYKPDIKSFWSEMKYKLEENNQNYADNLTNPITEPSSQIPQVSGMPPEAIIPPVQAKPVDILPQNTPKVATDIVNPVNVADSTSQIPVSPIVQPKLTLAERVNQLPSILAPADIVNPKDVAAHMNFGLTELKSIYKEIGQKAQAKVSNNDFVDMIQNEGKYKDGKNIPSELQSLVDLHKQVTDMARGLTGQSDNIGYQQNYFPHEDYTLTKVMSQLLPNTWIDKINQDFGHFQQRTGTMTDYSKSYTNVMSNYAEQIMLKKYEGNINPLKAGEQAMIDHVNKLEPDNNFNYIDTINPALDKPKVEWKMKVIDNARTANDLFNKMGTDVYKHFIKLRDSQKDFVRKQTMIDEMVAKNDKAGVVNFISDALGYTGESKTRFQKNLLDGINEVGLDRVSSEMLVYITKRQPIQEFVKNMSGYDFTSGHTKQFVNDFIDAKLKQGKLDQSISDTIFNSINRVFSMAQIGGNIKVALLQGTEVTRLFAQTPVENVFYGIMKSFTDRSGLKLRYGFGSEKTMYELINEKNPKVKAPNIVSKVIDKVLFGPLQAIENWKNQVYAGAGEAQGIKNGLKGQGLRDFVRNFVYERAHPADQYNTPMLLKDSAFSRLLLQYSQFSMKYSFQVKDAFAQKQYKMAIGLLTTQIVNLVAISAVAGVPLKFAISQIFPVGLGPGVTFLPDLYDKYTKWQDAIAQGNNSTSTRNKLIKSFIGNLIPAGSQIMKTKGMIDILQNDYAQSYGENPQYPAPTNGLEIFQGLVFGQNATKSQQDYYNSPLSKNPMSKTEGDIFKSTTPEARRGMYDALVTSRQVSVDKKKSIQDILGGGTAKVSDSSNLINSPTGPITIDSIIQKQQQESADNTFINEVLYGIYKDQPTTVKQQLLDSQGIDNTKIQNFYLGKLKAAPVTDRANYIIAQKTPDFTNLYKQGVLTQQVADQLERQRFIPNADALMKNLQMTDVYYQNKAIRSLQSKKINAVISLQRSQVKKLFSAQTASSNKIRAIVRNNKYKPLYIKKVVLPKFKGMTKPTGYKITKQSYKFG